MGARTGTLAGVAMLALGGCVASLPDLKELTRGCDALTDTAAEDQPHVFLVSTRLPDCRKPFLLLTVLRADRMRHALATRPRVGAKTPDIRLRSEGRWRSALADEIAADGGRVLLFIHGYNNDTTDALRRADAVAAAAGFTGPVVAFVWPSQRRTARYTWDEENARWAQDDADRTLRFLAETATRVVLVSHSMGNRLALDSLVALRRSDPALAARVDTVVLASADVDRAIFERDMNGWLASPGRTVTVYASRYDRALQASWSVHGYPRLGDVSAAYDVRRSAGTKAPRYYLAQRPVIADVVDTSDVSAKGLGHGDFLDAPAVNADLCRVVNRRPAPLPGRVGAPVEGAFLLTLAAAARPDCATAPLRLAPVGRGT